MGDPLRIPFWVDESLPVREILAILRNHSVQQVTIEALDPEILRSAEDEGAVVIVQDAGFLRMLYQYPRDHSRSMHRAGVVRLPGEWDKAEIRLRKYLPVIEALYRICAAHPEDQRLGIDLSSRLIHIHDHDPWV